MAIDITAGSWLEVTVFSEPLEFTLNLWGVTTFVVPAVRNPLADLIFDCSGADRFGDFDQGVLVFEPTISGTWGNVTVWSSALSITPDISGTYLEDTLTDADALAITPTISGDFYLDASRANWISWSDIGNLDFEITKKNVAGEMPLDWAGRVSNIHKLGNRFVVYGENGVSFVVPTGKLMGLNTIHRIGLLGRDAFAGNDFVHFFADKLGTLYQLGETLEKLDYKEFLSDLTDPVFSYDESQKLLYMCDGTTGYVYSTEFKSLGKCAPNITGIDYKTGTLYPAAPATITTPAQSIVTDIYDFGTRRTKTINMVEFSTDVSETMQAAVEYRTNKADSFISTTWKTVPKNGRTKFNCRGIEFMFKANLLFYEDFSIDGLRINIMAHV